MGVERDEQARLTDNFYWMLPTGLAPPGVGTAAHIMNQGRF
jgi:hypothetical protein